MIKKMPVFFLLLALSALAIPSFIYSAEITVRHGKFDHFNISMPDQIAAGMDAQIKLNAMDSLNNIITDFGESKKNFQISVTGSATVKPSSFDSASFTNGTLIINFNDKTAEPLTLSITEGDNPVPILSKEFSVSPNKLSTLVVKGPRSALAGERLELKIIEKDAFGNTVTEPIFGKNLNISFSGNTEPMIEMPLMPEFRNGVGTIGFVAQKAGTVAIGIKDMATGSSGTSENIIVKNGPLYSFRLLHPKEIIAGEPFDFFIVPVDRFGNLVSNYSSMGNGVAITSSGKEKPYPSNIPANEFAAGQVKVALRYDGAETVKIKVTEIGGSQSGESENIIFVPPTVDRFDIITPDSVVAGQKFKIKIIAYNQISHIMKNYNLVGTDVQLSTTGTGNLMPNRIPASEFVNGIAIVDVQYNKSESFEIVANAEKPKESANVVAGSVEAIREKLSKEEKAAMPGAKRISEINNVTVKEGKDKAIVAIEVGNVFKGWKYKLDTVTKEGRKWIIVKIKPAVIKAESPKVESSFVGSIVVEGDKTDKDAALVKIEMIKPARYHVSKKSDSLNIEIRH